MKKSFFLIATLPFLFGCGGGGGSGGGNGSDSSTKGSGNTNIIKIAPVNSDLPPPSENAVTNIGTIPPTSILESTHFNEVSQYLSPALCYGTGTHNSMTNFYVQNNTTHFSQKIEIISHDRNTRLNASQIFKFSYANFDFLPQLTYSSSSIAVDSRNFDIKSTQAKITVQKSFSLYGFNTISQGSIFSENFALFGNNTGMHLKFKATLNDTYDAAISFSKITGDINADQKIMVDISAKF